MQDKLFVISAPSAGGKTTIIERLISLLDGSLTKVITCTTRAKRESEVAGVDYKFLTKEQFNKHLKAGDFAEHATVYRNHYGVLKEDLIAKGLKIISLDCKGVETFRNQNVKATFVLIAPPSLDVLKKRLLDRGTDGKDDIALRLAEAEKELSLTHLYDHVIINDNLNDAVEALKKIITGEE